MLDFWEHLDLEELLNENFEEYQPLNGGWETPLSQNRTGYYYKFDVPGDECNRCYKVSISGDPKENVAISFSRDSSYADTHRGVGAEVFKGVLKALSEYFSVHSPKQIEWTAISKGAANPRTGEIRNPDARSKVYEHWSLRYLFPKYIGMQGSWVRRDVYENEYVPIGYPQVPEKITLNSSPKEKRKAYEEMQEKVIQNRDEIHRRRIEVEERRRQEERAAQEARERLIQQRLADPNENPAGIQKDDIVYQTGENLHSDQHGKVVDITVDTNNNLRVYVRFARNPWDENFSASRVYVPLYELRKETSEDKTRREEKRSEIFSDPEKNPHAIQKGDEVITWLGDQHDKENGLIGHVREIGVNQLNDLWVKISWSDEAKEVLQNMGRSDFEDFEFGIKKFRKATPENVSEIREKVRKKIREKEIEQRLRASRDNWQARARRSQNAVATTTTETPEEIVNHPRNPLHLKIGDLVKFTNPPRYGRNSRRTNWSGIISDLKIYGDYLLAYVRFHGSNARPIQVWNIAQDLVRDDSPETQTHILRQQARQQRAQRAINSTGGHQIGDVVTVLNGRHRGKSGHIVNFRYVGDNVSAIITPAEGPDFSVNIRMLQPPVSTPQPTAESFSFRDYLLYFESRINRE